MTPERWDFRAPVRVRFGVGVIGELAEHVRERALVVTTRGAAERQTVVRALETLDAPTLHVDVQPNPTISQLDDAIARYRGETVDAIVAIGGGSVIDTAKVLSLALGRGGAPVSDLLADSRSGAAGPPVIAVPTTAGTGSEVTPFATVWDDATRTKASVASPSMHPSVALVDPELSLTLPWVTTLSTGLDAYSQCFESIFNRHATPISTAFATRGVRLVPDALRALQRDLGDIDARTRMAEAALLSGLAISHTRTGLAHSMSYPVTAHFGLPHGLACALHLPAVLAFMTQGEDPSSTAHLRALDDRRTPLADSVIGLYQELGVAPVIREWVPSVQALRPHAGGMFTPGRADNAPQPVTAETVEELLDRTQAWFDQEVGG